jgi:acyl carrier protein
MEREVLRQSLLAKLEEDTGDPIGSLEDQVNLRTDLGLDSVDFVQMVIHVQDQFGIVLQSTDLENVVLVSDLLDVIQAKMAVKKHAA